MVRVRYQGSPRQISAHLGDIYLCDDEYRIGDPINGTPINVETKRGKILTYLLKHVGENVPYEKLGEISDSKNPREMMANLRNNMKSSKHFRFVGSKRDRPDNGQSVRLEERL